MTGPRQRRVRVDHANRPGEVAFMLAELARHGWMQTDGDDWDLFCSFEPHSPAVLRALRPDQRVNHFPGIMTMHRKDELAHFLPADQQVVPRTFVLPREHERWRQQAARDPAAVWILKPAVMLSGIGVRLLTDLDDVPAEPGWIVQRYIDDPLLLAADPHKHALRVFVLLTSLEPLTAYIHPTPIVKFASQPFSLTPAARADRKRHLTNPAVQGPDAVRNMSWPDYLDALERTGIDPARLWTDIRLAVTTLLKAHRDPMLRLSRAKTPSVGSCYELIGFDVTIDAAGRPWIVEANASPGVSARGGTGSATAAIQQQVKESVVRDLLRTIGAVGADRFHAAGEGEMGSYEPLLRR